MPKPAAAAPSSERPERQRRARKTQQRSTDTRDRILKAAAAEFASKNFDGASTRTIASAAGVQHTLVTYHFGSKEGLWQATLRHLNEGRRDRFEARLDGLRGVNDSMKLYLYLEDFVRYSAENPQFAWIMSNVASHPNPQLSWLIESYIRPGFASTAKLIKSAQEAGYFIDGDPQYLFYLLIGLITRIYMLSAEAEVILGESPFEEAFIERHTQTCLGLFFKKSPMVVLEPV